MQNAFEESVELVKEAAEHEGNVCTRVDLELLGSQLELEEKEV